MAKANENLLADGGYCCEMDQAAWEYAVKRSPVDQQRRDAVQAFIMGVWWERLRNAPKTKAEKRASKKAKP